MMDFDTAFKKLIGHEGGYVNNPRDPGGETKFGISKRSYPHEDIKNLTLERAKFLYRRDFWGSSGCDAVPDPIKYPMFDTGVNSGPETSILLLQKAVGTFQDGKLGPKTLAATNSMHPARLVAYQGSHRLLFMANAPTWPAHGRGWARRVANIILEFA